MVTLKTKRLTLRPYKPRDADALYKLLQDKTVSRMTAHIPWPYTRKHAREWVRKNSVAAHRVKRWKQLVFAIEHAGEFIGTIGLHNPSAGRVELGFWLAKTHRGRGFMTEAAQKVTAYALTRLCFQRVQATALVHNKASQRVQEKAGLRYEGLLRKYHVKDGKALDVVMYAKVR